jgi:hypothetical protein
MPILCAMLPEVGRGVMQTAKSRDDTQPSRAA